MNIDGKATPPILPAKSAACPGFPNGSGPDDWRRGLIQILFHAELCRRLEAPVRAVGDLSSCSGCMRCQD